MSNKIEFAGYTFDKNKACLVCEHVFSFSALPKIMVHDADGWLQFLCGETHHEPENSKTVGLIEIIDRLPDFSKVPALKRGCYAEEIKEGKWKVTKFHN